MCTLAPFLAKAIHVDDPLFVWAAQHIAVNPADCYGFDVNWYGRQQPMHTVTQNPPLWSYVLAVVGAPFAFHEVALHLATLMAALACTVGVYFLALQLGARPLISASAAWATPAMFVSSTTLMCDTALVALWCWAVLLWIRAIRTERPLWFFLSGLLVGLAGLTKYYGICLIPLLGAYALLHRWTGDRRFSRSSTSPHNLAMHVLGGLAVAAALLVAFDLWTARQYGYGLLREAILYAAETVQPTEAGGRDPLRQSLVTLGFVGGSIPIAAILAPFIWRPRIVAVIAVLIGGVWLLLAVTGAAESWAGPHVSDAGIGFVIQAVLMAAAGVAVVALPVWDLVRRRDPESWLLAMWVLGTLVFAGVLNWTTNARSLLPAVPAIALLIGRNVWLPSAMPTASGRESAMAVHLPRLVMLLIACSLALSISVAAADYRLAGSARQAADRVVAEFGTPRETLWFQGHWGFQYYMQAAGARPFDMTDVDYQPGTRLVIAENNTNRFRIGPLETMPDLAEHAELHFVGARWLTTISSTLGAGFYASEWGPLPYRFGAVPAEQYSVYRFNRPLRIRTQPRDAH